MASRTLTVVITGDARDAQRAFKDVEGGADSFGSKMSDLGGKLMGFGTKMSLGVTLPLAFLGKVAFNAASDMNESMSKVDAIFEGNSGNIKRWADGAATDFGQSKRSALDAAGSFGNMFLQLGIGLEPATKMSKKMTELASDFASFHNADITQVIEAQSAAFRGEYDALQKFVPTISAATVETKALEMTGKANADALTQQEKAAATYALMMEGAGKALGDYDRTADGAANKQRELTAKFEDAKAKIGDALIPIFQQLAEVVAKVSEWFGDLDPKWQKLIVFAGLAAAAIGPLATLMGGLVTVIGVLASPIAAVALAIGVLVAAAVFLYLKWDEVWSAVADHPALLLVLAPLGAILLPIIALVAAVKLVEDNWDTIWPALQSLVEGVGRALDPVFRAIGTAMDVVRWVTGQLVGAWQSAWPTIQTILEGAWSVMQGVFAAIGVAIDVVQWGVGVLSGVWSDIWNNLIAPAIAGAWAVMQPIFAALTLAIDVVAWGVGVMSGAASSAFDGVVTAASFLWGVASGPLGALAGAFETAYRAAKKLLDILPSIPNISGPGGPGLRKQLEDAGYGERALGGPVMAGGTYLVGEKGPELFSPSLSGHIIPNRQLAMAGTSRGGNNYSISVQVAPGGNPTETGRAIVESIREYERRAGTSWRN